MEILNAKQKIIIVIISITILLIISFYIIHKSNNKYELNIEEIEEKTIVEEEKTEKDKKIIVHISGAINEEGVISIDEGSRIINAIEEGGGITEEADLSNVNLAYELEDGQKIYIPKKNDEDKTYIMDENGQDIIEGNPKGKNDLVNINTASQTELETLTGIGPSTALKIINYREENGKFNKIEEIQNVAGIGENKYENLKDEICVK